MNQPKLTCWMRMLAMSCVVAGLSGLTHSAVAARKDGKPNIVFLMADDLGYGHLGCYGQEQIKTPNIDRMAREGMRFTDVYAGCAVCAPSRSALMTGLHTGHTPVRGNTGGIPLADEDVTVAEVLRKAGYATGLFGKWGLGDATTTGVPNRQGFDEFFGYLHQIHAHFHYPEYLWRNEEKYLLPGNQNGARGQYSHDEIVAQAMNFVRRHQDEPFFLYAPFTLPHLELLAPADAMKEYEGKFEETTPYVDKRKHFADQPKPRTAIAAMVSRLDRDVGRLLGLLRDLGLDENTIVFFTSDNGGPGAMYDASFFRTNGRLRGFKSDLYEGGIRVPMIVRWPGKITAGTVSDQVWAFWDFLPTAAQIAGTSAPRGIDGISILPALLGKKQQPQHEFFYWEFARGKTLGQAVRMGAWKAIRTKADAPLELYNVLSDAGELNDVANVYPKVVARIETYLKTTRTEPPPQIEPAKPPGRQYQ